MRPTLPLDQWLAPTRPDDTVIAWLGERRWTLGELRQDVIRLVTELQGRAEQRWALCFGDSYLFVVALLATLHAGKVPVIPGHCRASLLNEQQALFEGVLCESPLGQESPEMVVTSNGTSQDANIILPAIAAESHIELFTSGSTGQPKRVVKPVALLDAEARMLAAHFGPRIDGCHFVASVVPQHMYGLTFRIFLPMACGLPLHAAMLYYAEQLSTLKRDHRYVFISSPAFLKRLDPNLTPPPVSVLLSAGGALPRKAAEETRHWLGIWPDEIYGSTETGVIAWRHRVDNSTSWQLFPGITLCAEGEEWRLSSPLLGAQNGMLLEDKLELVDDGFRLAGRQGRVIKIEEKRISLSEIERRLMALEGITDAAAVAVSRGGRQGIGVVLVLTTHAHQQWRENGCKAQEMAWRRALLPWLEPVAIPRYWRVVDDIPANSMNKRIYAALEELFRETT